MKQEQYRPEDQRWLLESVLVTDRLSAPCEHNAKLCQKRALGGHGGGKRLSGLCLLLVAPAAPSVSPSLGDLPAPAQAW